MTNEYRHGGDIYRHPMEYDFSINVNPLGMPLAAVRAAHEGVVLCGRYPDPKAERLCEAIAQTKDVCAEHVIPGNGAAELLYALCRAVPGSVLTFAPTFTGYAEAAGAAGSKLRYVNLQAAAGASGIVEDAETFCGSFYDSEALAEALADGIDADTALVMICNPNNPTGALFTRKQILHVLAAAERGRAYVCVDECFLPFLAEEDAVSVRTLVREHPRLLVLRAFTKIYAMAGMRLGYMLSTDEKLRTRIRHGMQPWNTSIPAQEAGIAALSDSEYLAKTRDMLREERAYLVPRLSELVRKVYEGAGNFLLLRAEPNFGDRMLEHGVLVRSCGDFAGLDETYYRVGIRSHSENMELIRRMRCV